MADTLEKAGVEIKIVKRNQEYTDEIVKWADMIITTGGDGTFLMGASKILDKNKPVIGFNTDPTRSEGHLCLPKHYSFNIQVRSYESDFSLNWTLSLPGGRRHVALRQVPVVLQTEAEDLSNRRPGQDQSPTYRAEGAAAPVPGVQIHGSDERDRL